MESNKMFKKLSMRRHKLKSSSIADKVVKAIVLIILIAFCISLVFPVIWMIYTSFKDELSYLLDPFSWPEQFYGENYPTVIENLQVKVLTQDSVLLYGPLEMILFSFILATGVSFMSVLMPALVSYAVSKYHFFGKNFLFNLGIIVMIIPIVGALPSQMVIYRALGIYNNIVPYILVSASCFGFNFVLLYGSWKSISWSYAEAAFIDGAGHFTVFFRIMIPMQVPIFTTLFVLSFIGSWNDYMAPVVWLPSYPNLAYGMYYFQNEASRLGFGIPTVMAGFVVVSIPTAILFICSQRIITREFMVGGLKG